MPRIFKNSYRSNTAAAIAIFPAMLTAFALSPIQATIPAFMNNPLHWLSSWYFNWAIIFYLVFWVFYVPIFVSWTHIIYAKLSSAQLIAVAKRSYHFKHNFWNKISGNDSAVSWSTSGALVAAALTILIGQNDTLANELWVTVLGLLAVACSWTMMSYAFALEYLRLNATKPGIEFEFSGTPEFGDYLTLALQISCMAATAGATFKNHSIMRVVRTNTVLAFAFNTVIVAMMVSLLSSGIFQKQ